MFILYIGNFVSGNGPSTVDQSLLKVGEEIYPLQATKKYISTNELKAIYKCDICHISAVSIKGLIVGVLCKLLGKKITFTMHGTLKIERNFRKIKKHRLLTELLLIKISNKVFTVSDCLGQKVKSLYKNEEYKIISIPNGINNYKIKNTIKEFNSITCIGGGRKEKRVLDVCKAVNLLNKKGENIIINVLGEDSEDTEKIKKYNFVNYYGFIPQEKVLNILSKTKVFIQYSEYEPFSLSIFDAMQFNCNIIASNHVGAIEYLNELDLKKISISNNSDELINCIEKQLSNPTFSYSTYDKLSWNNIYCIYKKNWEELTNA